MELVFRKAPKGNWLTMSHKGDEIPVITTGAWESYMFSANREGCTPLEIFNIFSLDNLHNDELFRIIQCGVTNMGIVNDKNKDSQAKIELEKALKSKALDFNSVKAWAVKNIEVPKSIHKDFSKLKGDVRFDPLLTYIHEDYLDLCCLAIIIKGISPLLATIMAKNRGSHERLKELHTVRLFPKWFDEIPPVKKLTVFLNRSISKKKALPTETMFDLNISSAQLSDWVKGLVITRRLISAAVLKPTDRAHIVSYVYNLAVNKLNHQPRHLENKFTPSGVGEEESSVLEAHRTREATSILDKVMYSISGEESYYLNHYVNKYNIHLNEYYAIRDSLHAKVANIAPGVITILSWLYVDRIDTTSFMVLTRDQIKGLMALAHLILRDDHPHLATIMLASADLDEAGDIIHRTGIRSRLTPDLIEELNSLTPWDNNNPLTKIIDQNISMSLMCQFSVLVPYELIRQTLMIHIENGQVVHDKDLKKHIANFIIDINKED